MRREYEDGQLSASGGYSRREEGRKQNSQPLTGTEVSLIARL